jgi:phosphate acetyltransferase
MNTRSRNVYERLIEAVKAIPPMPTSVAHRCDESSLAGAVDAAKLGIIAPILVGPRHKILAAAAEAKLDITLRDRRRGAQSRRCREGGCVDP